MCCAEFLGEGRSSRVSSLDLVDVGRIEWGGEGAKSDEVGMRGGEGVSVEVQHVDWRAMFGVDEGFGLSVAVGRDVSPAVERKI